MRLKSLRNALLAGAAIAALAMPALGHATSAGAAVGHGIGACSVTGPVEVTDTDNSTVLGYVSDQWNSFGENIITTTPADDLTVTVPVGTPTLSEIEVIPTNGPNSTYPDMGGIDGFANTGTDTDLTSGSPNYAYVGGTTSTAPGSTPSAGANAFTNATGIDEDIESTIWTLGTDGTLTPQWVNSDDSTPPTYLVENGGILVMTGDVSEFTSTFGPSPDISLTVQPTTSTCTQSISLTNSESGTQPVGAQYAPAATATSGLPVSFSIDSSSTTGACAISSGVVTFTGLGSCVIDADQSGDAEYPAAATVPQTVSVGQATSSMGLSASPIGGSVYAGSVMFSAQVTAGDPMDPVDGQTVTFYDGSAIPANQIGLPVTVTQPGGVGTAFDASVSTAALSGGGHTITAVWSGDTDDFGVTQTLDYSVSPATQTVSFTSPQPGAPVAGQQYTPTAMASSTLPVTISVDASSTTGTCTMPSTTVTFTAPGMCIIDAVQAGNDDYVGASATPQTMTVAKAPSTITLSGAPSGGTTYGDTAVFTAQVNAGDELDALDGQTVTFYDGAAIAANQIGSPVTVSQPGGVGTPFVAMTAPVSLSGGSHTIMAVWSGDPDDLGTTQSVSYDIEAASQTISFTSTPPAHAVVDGQTYTPTATASSGLTVSLSIAPSSSVCSMSGGVVHFLAPGTCTIDAGQAGNSDYNAAPEAFQQITVAPALPGAPTTLRATSSANRITLTWTAPGFDGGAKVTEYRIFRGLTSGHEDKAPIATTRATSFVDTTATPSVTYFYVVEAVNTAGVSIASNETSASIFPVPAAGDFLAASPTGAGWWVLNSNETVSSFGDVKNYGSPYTCHAALSGDAVGITATPDGRGYWVVSSGGSVLGFGDAHVYGTEAAAQLHAPIAGLVATPSGHGYWLFAQDGGVFSFGNAHFEGSFADHPLSAPVVAMSATSDGLGYWLATSSGQVLHCGDAADHGSVTHQLFMPIVGMTRTPNGRGYWLVASDGGVFAFGGAGYYGSDGGKPLRGPPIIGLIAKTDGKGYSLINQSGQAKSFGS